MRQLVLPLLAALLVASPLAAQHVVDQQQLLGTSRFANAEWWTAQTFRTSSGNISGGGVLMQNNGASSPSYLVKLWSGDPSVAGSSELASVLVTPTLGPVFSTFWVEGFWSPVAATSGLDYWLIVGGGPSTTDFMVNSDGNAYLNGRATTGASTTVTDAYLTTRPLDLVFRTYTTAPEPSALVLTGVGLVALAGLASRPRRGSDRADC